MKFEIEYKGIPQSDNQLSKFILDDNSLALSQNMFSRLRKQNISFNLLAC